jgi:hypothetical protein
MNADKLIRGYSSRNQKVESEKDNDGAKCSHKANLHEDNLLNKLLGHRLETNRKKTTRVAGRYQKAPLLPVDTQSAYMKPALQT